MAIETYLIQYVHDLRRHEPRNVGIAVASDEQVVLRFVHENLDGSVDGRKLQRFNLNKDYYQEWIAYLRRKAGRNQWDEVLRFQASKPSNIVVRRGGLILDPIPLSRAADEYFADVVDVVEKDRSDLDRELRAMIQRTGVEVVTKPKVSARWGKDTPLREVEFDYQVANRATSHGLTVVTKVPLQPLTVMSFAGKAAAAHSAGAINLIAVTSTAGVQAGQLESLLVPLDDTANTIDLDATDPDRDFIEALRLK